MKRKILRSPVIGILAVLLISLLIGMAIGKYVTTKPVSGTVTFNARLVEKLELLENEVERRPDGSYMLTDRIATANENGDFNEFHLIPGQDVPKNPYIQITGKSISEVFLYLEVVASGVVGPEENAIIHYAPQAYWHSLGITGEHGGTVYVYGTQSQMFDNEKIDILSPLEAGKPETIRVSQNLPTDGSFTGSLTFYAAMGEAALSDETDPTEKAKEVYIKIYNP